jgi:hypothetical protein
MFFGQSTFTAQPKTIIMLKTKIYLAFIALTALSITSCVSLKNGKVKYQKVNNSFNITEKINTLDIIKNDQALLPSINLIPQKSDLAQNNLAKLQFLEVSSTEIALKDSLKGGNCDKILLKDGNEILAKIIEIGPDAIKYKRCENLDGPLYVSDASAVTSITFSNGTTEIIKSKDRTSATVAKKPSKNGTATVGLVLGIIGLSIGVAFTILLSNLLMLIAAALGLIAIILAINAHLLSKKNPDSKLGRILGVVSAVLGGLSLISLTLIFVLSIIL